MLNIAAGYATKRQYDDEVTMMAAGILEGALTYRWEGRSLWLPIEVKWYTFSHRQLYLFYQNLYDSWFSTTPVKDLQKVEFFFSEQVSSLHASRQLQASIG